MLTTQSVLENLSWLEDFTDYSRTDDSSKWRTDRPGLEVYRQAGFRIPSTSEPFSQIQLYGDFRDEGYILSYKQESNYPEARTRGGIEHFGGLGSEFMKAEHARPECGLLLNCYLPALEYACEEQLRGNCT